MSFGWSVVVVVRVVFFFVVFCLVFFLIFFWFWEMLFYVIVKCWIGIVDRNWNVIYCKVLFELGDNKRV